ncbi:MAG: MFS transporter [Myxococcales bacterium]|nr:MFS transporter [Myxococcales bacterium]
MERKQWHLGMLVATLYFAEGWPYILVNTASVVLLKDLGVSNEWLGMTSLFHLPWVIKMLWSPLIDGYGEKRSWITWTQLLMAAMLVMCSVFLPMTWGLWGVVWLFFGIAFLSATHDMAVDGLYIQSLDEKSQANFVGLRVMMYRIAMIAGSGGLVIFAGLLRRQGLSVIASWSMALALAGVVMGLLGIFHFFGLRIFRDAPHASPKADEAPTPAQEKEASPQKEVSPQTEQSVWQRYIGPFKFFLQQDGILRILAFIFLYRLGEALLLKMVQPFLLDSVAKGGLGLKTDTVGLVYGTVGAIASIGGGILGGAAIARWGLRRCVWPMMLLMNVPDLLYMLLARGFGGGDIVWVYAFVGVEQWGYGVGFSVFTVVLMRIASQSSYASAFFAISTGLMALGLMFPGMVSGWLQKDLGYGAFFGVAFLFSLVGMWSAWMLPSRLWEEASEEEKQRLSA